MLTDYSMKLVKISLRAYTLQNYKKLVIFNTNKILDSLEGFYSKTYWYKLYDSSFRENLYHEDKLW